MPVKLTKDKKFEYVYLMNVPCVYASVLEPKKKHSEPLPDAKNQSKNEYSITVFVTDEERAVLEDECLINKQLFKVGVDKNKKRKIKFPIKDEDGGETVYTPFKGLHGIQLTLNELNNSGNPNKLAVVDAKGEPFGELVGNGSVVHVKLYGYRNREDLLNVALTTIVVVDHVPYEGGSGGVIHDDILGIDIDLNATTKSKAVKDEFSVDDGQGSSDDDVDDDDF